MRKYFNSCPTAYGLTRKHPETHTPSIYVNAYFGMGFVCESDGNTLTHKVCSLALRRYRGLLDGLRGGLAHVAWRSSDSLRKNKIIFSRGKDSQNSTIYYKDQAFHMYHQWLARFILRDHVSTSNDTSEKKM